MLHLYEPREAVIVLGAGRKAEEDVDLGAAGRVGIPVRKRRGGGGTVLLTPGQAVLALVTEVASPFRNREYALQIGAWVIEALDGLGVHGVVGRGISDLAMGERKILGASIYRSRNVLFYQASLLVDMDIGLFARYLRYPSRVPDYRAGRSHREFCTTLAEQGYRGGVSAVLQALRRVAEREIPRLA